MEQKIHYMLGKYKARKRFLTEWIKDGCDTYGNYHSERMALNEVIEDLENLLNTSSNDHE